MNTDKANGNSMSTTMGISLVVLTICCLVIALGFSRASIYELRQTVAILTADRERALKQRNEAARQRDEAMSAAAEWENASHLWEGNAREAKTLAERWERLSQRWEAVRR